MSLSSSAAIEDIFERLGKHIKLATPLGLGKPNKLLNLLYDKVKQDPTLSLTIHTGLSLNPPRPEAELARRFFEPFAERHWGNDYPRLAYADAAARNKLPPNVKVHEFYFQAGAALTSKRLQRDYQSINYTHVAESVLQAGVEVLVQLVACDASQPVPRYSLSSNPDVTLDLVDLYRKRNRSLLVVGVVHPSLPFLGGEAEVAPDFFDMVVEDVGHHHELFAVPRMPVTDADHAIGFYASQLVIDGGTLQLGIGALSDCVVESMLLRHRQNAFYTNLVLSHTAGTPAPGFQIETKPFSLGLYGLSELISDGFVHLRRAGILRRTVTDEKSGRKTYLHGAFYLGSKDLYAWLRGLNKEDFNGIRLTRVSKVNDLYDPNELLLRAQRKHPRFLNTCMQVTLLGGAASDTLEDGRVVSGVGGQYNFVSMAQELEDSRSILMLRSSRFENGRRISNIVCSHGHLTIPRHLRDIVITEYGIADLRGKSDEETIRALLNIADSEFQDELSRTAKKYGKLAQDYEIPEWANQNSPASTQRLLDAGRKHGFFKTFPLGSDFTPLEEKLIVALEWLKTENARGGPISRLALAARALYLSTRNSNRFRDELERMKLTSPGSAKQFLFRALLLKALSETATVTQ